MLATRGEGCWKTCLRRAVYFAIVGGDNAVGQAGGVELAAGMGGEERGDDPEDGERGEELEADGCGARGGVGFEPGVEANGDPDGDEG